MSAERPHKELDHTWHRLALSWSTAAGVCYLFSAREQSLQTELCSCGCQTIHIHTCWGLLMSIHSNSSTCPKNSRASHTKSSGISSKETLSTLLCTRLPAGRQGGKDKCSISRSTHLWQPLHNTVVNALVGIVGDQYIYYHHYIQWLKKWTAIAKIHTQ